MKFSNKENRFIFKFEDASGLRRSVEEGRISNEAQEQVAEDKGQEFEQKVKGVYRSMDSLPDEYQGQFTKFVAYRVDNWAKELQRQRDVGAIKYANAVGRVETRLDKIIGAFNSAEEVLEEARAAETALMQGRDLLEDLKTAASIGRSPQFLWRIVDEANRLKMEAIGHATKMPLDLDESTVAGQFADELADLRRKDIMNDIDSYIDELAAAADEVLPTYARVTRDFEDIKKYVDDMMASNLPNEEKLVAIMLAKKRYEQAESDAGALLSGVEIILPNYPWEKYQIDFELTIAALGGDVSDDGPDLSIETASSNGEV